MVSGWPTFVSPICLYTPIHSYAPRGVHAPICPIFFMPLCVFGGFACCGRVVMGSPLCLDTLLTLGVPPPYTPTLSHWFPVHQYVSGISVCYMGISLLSVRVWGCFPICWGGGGIITWDVHMLIHVLFCSAFCLTFPLWLWLLLLQLQWYLLACLLCHQWQRLLPVQGFQWAWISMVWFQHHPWCQEALEEVLAQFLCLSSNLL